MWIKAKVIQSIQSIFRFLFIFQSAVNKYLINICSKTSREYYYFIIWGNCLTQFLWASFLKLSWTDSYENNTFSKQTLTNNSGKQSLVQAFFLAIKLLVGMPTYHIKGPEFQAWLHFLTMSTLAPLSISAFCLCVPWESASDGSNNWVTWKLGLSSQLPALSWPSPHCGRHFWRETAVGFSVISPSFCLRKISPKS